MYLDTEEEDIISVYSDVGEKIYELNVARLFRVWPDGKTLGYEWYHAEVYGHDPNLLFLIMTAASNQSGIVAIFDMKKDKLVHYHNGAYALKAEKIDNLVITIYGVYYYGVKYHNSIDAVEFGNKKLINGSRWLVLPPEYEFEYKKGIQFDTNNKQICVSDSTGESFTIDIDELDPDTI